MNSGYNDKLCNEKWDGSGRPSRPASDGPDQVVMVIDDWL